jgi:hypothetical protein
LDFEHVCQLAGQTVFSYTVFGSGRVEDRFLRSNSEGEESPNTTGRDAA